MKTTPTTTYTIYMKQSPQHTTKKGAAPQYRISHIEKEDTFSRSTNHSTNRKNVSYVDRREYDSQLRRRAEARKRKAKQKRIKTAVAGFATISSVFAAATGFFCGGRPMAITPSQTPTLMPPEPSAYVDTYEPTETQDIYVIPESTEVKAQKILKENPEVKMAYDKLFTSVNRFSDQLDDDGIALITERVEQLGNNRVDVLDVLKILHIESRGRIYDPDEEGEILTNKTTGATGSFQLLPSAVQYVNDYFHYTGTDKELDIKDPYDNLDACILYLRIISALKNDQLQNGIIPLSGENLKEAMAWGYHDGPWADHISTAGQNYINDFRSLSVIDNFPDVVDYLLNR